MPHIVVGRHKALACQLVDLDHLVEIKHGRTLSCENLILVEGGSLVVWYGWSKGEILFPLEFWIGRATLLYDKTLQIPVGPSLGNVLWVKLHLEFVLGGLPS